MKRKQITAQNQWSDPLTMADGVVTFVMQGTWDATVKFQVRPLTDVNDAAWADANTGWTTMGTTDEADPVRTSVQLSGEWQVRFGVDTGGWNSGTLNGFMQVGRAYGA